MKHKYPIKRIKVKAKSYDDILKDAIERGTVKCTKTEMTTYKSRRKKGSNYSHNLI